MFVSIILEPTIESWNLAKLLLGTGPWYFRGQTNASWGLSSSLERTALQFGQNLGMLENRERFMLSEFQRQAHLYSSSLPNFNNQIEWLALMQHHGCPTRLLDFSVSFYVASFFAMEQAIDDAVIWGINFLKLRQGIIAQTGIAPGDETISGVNNQHLQLADEFLQGKREPQNLILSFTPFLLTQRLAIQNGLFLMPCKPDATFEDNLIATYGLEPAALGSPQRELRISEVHPASLATDISVTKIIIPKKCHTLALFDLRLMNITTASLFPGLDGFARSLRQFLRYE